MAVQILAICLVHNC